MKKFLLPIFFTLYFFTTNIAFAQYSTKSFPADSVAFFETMTDFLMQAREKEGKNYMLKDFIYDWYGGKFTEDQRKQVYEVTNLMLEKKKRPFPDFYNYLYTIQQFVNSKYQTPESFTTWHETLKKLLSKRNKKIFNDYLEFSSNLFYENLIYKSPNVQWASSNNNYKFDYDSLPKLVFEALDLKCYSKGDSSVIYNTSGTYYPTENKWIGKGGKITWQRAGYSPDSVWAELDEYQISVNTPTYKIENVTFYDLFYFDKPLKGSLEEKVLANITPQKASYPRFDSYDKRIVIKNLTQNVDYDGGFSLYGRKVVGKGNEGEDALILVYNKEKQLLFKAASQTFIIRPEKVVSESAAITLYIGQDSIYHPGLNFKLFLNERKITLYRNYEGLTITPYFNSFHQLDMDFEFFIWKIDDPLIEFTNLVGGTKSDAHFESANYFKMERFMQIQGRNDYNPLVVIKKYVDKQDTNVFHLDDMVNLFRLSPNQVELMLVKLSTMGFVTYRFDTKQVTIKQKLIDYVLSAAGKKDYDVIVFHSDIKNESNATLSLLNYDLKIRGVSNILLSDSQQVMIFPKHGEITVKKNRDFDFAGVVRAGRFIFFGKQFDFQYNSFKVNLTNVDSTIIYAETGHIDQNNKPIIEPVKSVIENLNGDLLIDNPFNKSGYKDFPEYPIFNSFKESYVYYDKRKIEGGVYHRDNFYFQLEPFTIDSLDNFTNKALRFDGTFVSAGIFPEFEETLTLQADHSLGFIRKTPPGGFQVYGGKGTFDNKIMLSNKGLKADGKLEYLTSTSYSKQFNLYPDSLNGIADFEIKAQQSGIEYPPVTGDDVMIRWYPKKDLMITQKLENAIVMYDGISKLHGKTFLRPDGLTGRGLYEFERAEMESNLMRFKYNDFTSDTADFRLKDPEIAGELTFSTKNVNAYISFEKRYGEFKSNGGGSVIEFPQNQYICYMEEFKWYMDNDDIELSAGEAEAQDASGVKLEGSQFISIHPEQDSLSFYSPKARYDVRKHIIQCNEVKYINVADAMIYPDSGLVIIDKKAKMRTLENAQIVANYITQYHNMYNANINIFGKRSYAGNAYIDFVDELDQKQTIYLQSVSVDTTGQTIANGVIADTAHFTLSPHYDYQGKVNLYGSVEPLTFNGYARMKHDCEMCKPVWFSFKSQIEPKDIYIPVDSNTKDISGNKLIASVLLSADSLGAYTAFLNRKLGYSHTEMLRSTGYLYFDKTSEEYKIASKDKIQEMSFGGNYLSLNTKNCKVYGEGKINLGSNLGQVKIETAGNIIQNTIDKETLIEALMMIDFYFNDAALEKMAKHMLEIADAEPTKTDNPTYEKALRELIGKENADKLLAQASLYGSFKKIPAELQKSLVLSQVKFKWNPETKSYISFGKIGVGNILKEQANRYFDGKIEIIKKRSGDVINIYIELDPNNWYFFTYQRGMMQTISSNDEYNTIIKETKPSDRKYKHQKGEQPYQFMYSTVRKKDDFLKKFDN
jgi:hypothetical protein